MNTYYLYQQYAARFGHTFSEHEQSDKSWKAAQFLMQQALDGSGPAVTSIMIRQQMRVKVD
jgi:hypothetical protein